MCHYKIHCLHFLKGKEEGGSRDLACFVPQAAMPLILPTGWVSTRRIQILNKFDIDKGALGTIPCLHTKQHTTQHQ